MPRPKKPHLKQRPDGRYRCKYQDQYFYGRTEAEAFAARDEYIRSEVRGPVSPSSSVQSYALPWLSRTFPTVSESTYAGLAIHLQHLVNVIGTMPISQVKPSDIKEIYSSEYKNLSNSYIKSGKQLFCLLFDAMVADGLCRSNPARDKTAKPHRGSGPKTRPITPQEREWIETLCRDHRAFPAVMTMLYAGIRPPEMKAFVIDRDVDFENNIITLQEFAHYDKTAQGYTFTETGKTKDAARQIPLFPPLAEVLKGKTGDLITSAHGERVNHTTWNVVWNSYKYAMETAINGMPRRWYLRTKAHKAILAEADRLRKEGKEAEARAKEAEIPPWISFDIVPYNLRHSFCVMCRDAGVEINTCRRWMGHADAKMILKVYDSVSEDRSENERKKVETRRIRGQIGGQTDSEQPGTVAL